MKSTFVHTLSAIVFSAFAFLEVPSFGQEAFTVEERKQAVQHGLNYTWAMRRIDPEMAEREGGIAFEVGIPTEKVGRADSTKIGDKPVSLPTARSSLQMAVRLLGSLCYRLSSIPAWISRRCCRSGGIAPRASGPPLRGRCSSAAPPNAQLIID